MPFCELPAKFIQSVFNSTEWESSEVNKATAGFYKAKEKYVEH
jgi:hypothetical protein